jgi:hypothetical protein
MALTPTQCAELQRLRAQLAELGAGGAITVTQFNGRRTEFAKGDPKIITDRIAELERLEAGGRRRGALRFRV